ncbi:phage tail protein [Niastella yeongjuensis]|nr:tail fiber protein [Niastella yeongjuensis]SEP27326.1 Microcystin-dependent protein [Niastella yeongjuensis]
MDGYIGDIKLFAGNFAPKNWMFCQGQLLSIATNTVVFYVLGTRYGGNGTTNFALPDLRSRMPVGAGQGAGLSAYSVGQKGGVETVTLQPNNFPVHSHTLPNVGMNCYTGYGNTDVPFNNYPARIPGKNMYATTMPSGTTMPTVQSVQQTSSAGADTLTPINLIQPVLAINFIICVQGQLPISTI